MKSKSLLKLLGAICLAAVVAIPFAAGCAAPAEKYPTKNITYLVPWNPGGQSDIEARRQQPLLQEYLGVSVPIVNKAGGGGAIGWAELVRTEPDGYLMCGINIPHIVLQPIARSDAGYTTEELMEGVVALFQDTPIGLAVQKDMPVNSVADFIKYAKENPGKITVGGSGTYSGHHITLLQFQKLTGVELAYIPATGAAPQIKDFLGGHTMAVFANSNDLFAHQDKCKVLAIGSEDRFPALPDVPTFIEEGVDMTTGIQRGVAVPPGTPPEIIKALEDAFLKIANDPKIQETMVSEGFLYLTMGHDESAAFIAKKKEIYAAILAEVL
ncbi:MAG: tripartite tricarboxylate transporter substrate binding protein [Dehalococcoidia bacterium]|nr:tripartite tricarboxylate transporter substrate binding protein [Dehalococcoidia bacterium]